MLTDVFARRYQHVPMWETFTEPARRLIAQTFQLLEDIVPYYSSDGTPMPAAKASWTTLHSLLARELGLKELSPFQWGYWTPAPSSMWISGTNEVIKVCETWALKAPDGSMTADQHVKERLSLVELGFRKRGEMVAEANAKLPQNIAEADRFLAGRAQRKGGIVLPGSQADGMRAWNAQMNAKFEDAINELNARFTQAGCNLNYHNGFVQISGDALVATEVERPFWALIADAKWKNVDYDMKEAIDLRDTNGRDPAFYAARALESTIKIISAEKNLTTGKEKGAHNYIDNLRGGGIVEVWELEALKAFFTKVRNPLGHGPGDGAMPTLNLHQTNWAIENSMSWVKSLVRRM